MLPRRRRRLIVFLLILLAYALTMTFGGCASKLLLFPTIHEIAVAGGQKRAINVDGKRIDIWTFRSPGEAEPEGFVLEFCGNATRAEHIVKFVADQWGKVKPIEAWVVNYAGYGSSEGPASLRSIAPAALAAYDALVAEAKGRPIFVAGNSLGTAAALFVAARRPVAGMVLQNPPPLRQLILGKFGWWNLWLLAGPVALQIPADLSSVANAPRVNAPAVFLSSMADEIIPPSYHRKVIDAYAGEKRIIEMPDADHNWSLRPSEEARLQDGIRWLWDHVQRNAK